MKTSILKFYIPHIPEAHPPAAGAGTPQLPVAQDESGIDDEVPFIEALNVENNFLLSVDEQLGQATSSPLETDL